MARFRSLSDLQTDGAIQPSLLGADAPEDQFISEYEALPRRQPLIEQSSLLHYSED
jgi:hypothetical protein